MDTGFLLNDVPDIGDDPKRVTGWIEARLATLASAVFDEEVRNTFVALTVPDAASTGSVLGAYASPQWWRLAVAALLADWACYEKPADRADFARLVYVLACFPAGFRVWMCRLPDGLYTPVGYTAWYPIVPEVFDFALSKPESITHRGFMMPLRALQAGGSYLYLFNVSIVPRLRGATAQSRLLMQLYAADLAAVKKLGMAAVTVSEDGARLSRRFGLAQVGLMMFEDEPEAVFAVRYDTAR
jgi:hypothetical protein